MRGIFCLLILVASSYCATPSMLAKDLPAPATSGGIKWSGYCTDNPIVLYTHIDAVGPINKKSINHIRWRGEAQFPGHVTAGTFKVKWSLFSETAEAVLDDVYVAGQIIDEVQPLDFTKATKKGKYTITTWLYDDVGLLLSCFKWIIEGVK